MKKQERLDWIMNWFKEHPRESVDVLNEDFVNEYADHTDAKTMIQFFGAPKCPQLGRDLGALFKQRKVRRVASGLPAGDAAMGFPKWVYSYRLKAN